MNTVNRVRTLQYNEKPLYKTTTTKGGDMGILDILFGRNKGASALPTLRLVPKKDLTTLIQEYKSTSAMVSFLPFNDQLQRSKWAMDMVKEAEERIIKALPDGLEKDVCRIFSRHNVDFLFIIESDGWQETMRNENAVMCHFLKYCSEYEEDEGSALPFEGNEFLFWIIAQADGAPSPQKRPAYIGAALKSAMEKSEILGRAFQEDELESFHIDLRLIPIFIGPWAQQFAILVDICCDVPRGRALVRELLQLPEIEA